MSTVFGWVLMGKTSSAPDRNIVTMCSTMDSVDRTLQRFLENEDVPTVEKSSQADLECEHNINQPQRANQMLTGRTNVYYTVSRKMSRFRSTK
ncbi:unnamed protein product [Macrosiphum euphorbiae]|uniref:Uncharacterized protein n=1 Tax=Macrosiphum euphorbiae TaxID=13131 RepID=A0AAV0Y7G4_9HEMI|nr:unnamed protein product [Macrosiphum euphorbiae]